MKNWFITTEPRITGNYKGITEHSHPGLHSEIAQLFVKHVPLPATVLDVGAGAGAFSLRLKDLGYQVTALDIDPEKWNVPNVDFQVLDINKGIAASVGGEFDALCCQEVIEHVENPWALMRDLYAVLRPGGVALVSTPHVANFLSRLLFLRTGNHYGFGPEGLDMGHINPIQPYEMHEIIRNLGWKLLHSGPVGYLPVMDFGIGMSPGRFPYKLLSNISRLIAYIVASGPEKRGWCLAFVLQKPTS
jgi:2-polyprenyl-3-methyl-5-hydroxy-6-metoxy-1,4-benzoquinol methylase